MVASEEDSRERLKPATKNTCQIHSILLLLDDGVFLARQQHAGAKGVWNLLQARNFFYQRGLG